MNHDLVTVLTSARKGADDRLMSGRGQPPWSVTAPETL